MNNPLSSHTCDRVNLCHPTMSNPATRNINISRFYDERGDLDNELAPAVVLKTVCMIEYVV